jgi:hypothetical protein
MLPGLAGCIGGLGAAAESGGGADPSFANVVLLCGFEGTNGSTSLTDESVSAHTMTANGTAAISTAQSKFGTSSLRLTGGTAGYVSSVDSADWWLGSHTEWTVEFFIRFNTAPSGTSLGMISQAASTSGASSWYFSWSVIPSGPRFSCFNSTTQTSLDATLGFSTGQWYHWAAARDASNNIRVFIDGAMIKKQLYANSMNNSSEPLRIGKWSPTSSSFDGWMDELRITAGVCRYDSDSGFTVPAAAFPRS